MILANHFREKSRQQKIKKGELREKLIDKTSDVYFSFDSDLDNKSFWDVFFAHGNLGLPLHHYCGKISIKDNKLCIEGKHKKTGKVVELSLPKESIVNVFHGFDTRFKRRHDRGWGLGFVPLRIQFIEQDGAKHKQEGVISEFKSIYLVIDYSRWTRGSSNSAWTSHVTNWLKAD